MLYISKLSWDKDTETKHIEKLTDFSCQNIMSVSLTICEDPADGRQTAAKKPTTEMEPHFEMFLNFIRWKKRMNVLSPNNL